MEQAVGVQLLDINYRLGCVHDMVREQQAMIVGLMEQVDALTADYWARQKKAGENA